VGHDADHTPPSSAEVKKELSYTSTHPMGPPGPVTGFPLPLHMTCNFCKVIFCSFILQKLKCCWAHTINLQSKNVKSLHQIRCVTFETFQNLPG
jgi:hypothetical protein